MLAIPLFLLAVFAISFAKTCEPDPEDKSHTILEANKKMNTVSKLLMDGNCDLSRLELYSLSH